MSLNFKTIIAASIVGLAGATAAFAADADAPVADHSFAINYSDLDLSTETGNRVLYKRIREAAQKVCPAVRTTGSRIPVRDRQCVENAVEQAVKGIHNPMLAQVHATYERRIGG